MKYAEFKNGLESGDVFSVYLFEGEDAFFRERGLSLLKNKFVTGGNDVHQKSGST